MNLRFGFVLFALLLSISTARRVTPDLAGVDTILVNDVNAR